MKKFVTSFLLCGFLFGANLNAVADTVWTDDGIDEVVVKQYDTKKVDEEFLPELPESLKNQTQSDNYIPPIKTETPKTEAPKKTTVTKKPTTQQTKLQTGVTKTAQQETANSKNYVAVKKGTKFYLRIEQPINDSAQVGQNVYFTSLYPEINNFITIPKGTKFIGKVKDSHLPQISANGGLLVIAIDRMVYKGTTYPIKSKVVMVGNQRVFQNNIKGKHTYWKGVANATKPGVRFYSKSWGVTKKFAGEGLEIVLTPITFVGGVAVMAGNTIASPVVALFSKGKRLFINKGAHFQVILMEDVSVRL